MPTYDYRCNACRHEFEQYQSIKDKPLKKCPTCGKSALERLIGMGAAVIFKGGGFYQTDYRSESYKKAQQADTKPAGDAAASGDTPASKPDAKPAAASDPKPVSKPGTKSESKPDPKPAKDPKPDRKSKSSTSS